MNELNDLISLVKSSSKPVQELVDEYFSNIIWSILKSEYDQMTTQQKRQLIKKLEGERK